MLSCWHSQASQPSPGGQSTCSSDQSPISTHPSGGVQLAVSAGRLPGEGLEEDGEKEDDDEVAEEECECEQAPIMDSTVSTATAAMLTLQARRSVGRPLRWMEHIKMERLKQVNGALPRLGPLSPTPPPKASTLPSIMGKGKALHSSTVKAGNFSNEGLVVGSSYVGWGVNQILII